MSGHITRTSDVEVDVRALARSLLRAMPIILILAIFAGAATFAGLRYATPKYTAQARIIIQAGESDLTKPAGANSAETQAMLDQEGVASQVQVISSREVSERVVKRLNLAGNPEFDPTVRPPSKVTTWMVKFGLAKDSSGMPADEQVLAEYNKHLSVYPIEKTRVIAVEFSASDPNLAAQAANAVAEEYIAFQRTVKADANSDATNWLESQIADLSKKVKDAEAKVEAYRASSDLLTTGGGDNSATLSQQQLADLSAELTKVRGARADAEAKAAQIRAALNSGTAANATEVINSELIQRLREQEIGLRAQIAQLSSTLLPGHPRMRELSAQVADLDGQIRAQAQKILQGLENDSRLAQVRENQINQDLAKLKTATATSNQSSVELRALEREAGAQRDLLNTYLVRYREAIGRQSGNYLPADARIISRASPPIDPSFPKKIPMAGAAMVAILVLGSLFVIIRELVSGRPMRTVTYNEPLPIVPGEIPVGSRIRWSESGDVRRIMPRDPALAPPAGNTHDRSLANIAARITGAQAKRVIVTQAEHDPAKGRPLAAVALARALARTGRRVVLVDFRQDGADRVAMGEESELPGFSDLYAGEAAFAQVIFRDRSSPAHFIPAGLQPFPADVDQARLTTLTEALDHTYDHVVFDADDAAMPLLAAKAAVAVVVTEIGAADPRTTRAYERTTALVKGEVMVLVADQPLPPAEAVQAGEAA